VSRKTGKDEEMAKRKIKPATLLNPLPVCLITCQAEESLPNILTVAAIGICCFDPPMIGVSIRPSRCSHGLIKESGEFVVNVPNRDLLRQVDLCGSVSGKDQDKFFAAGLTALPAEVIRAPLIQQCPINIECQVRQIITLGSHDLFLAQVVATHMDEEYLDEAGNWRGERLQPLAYHLLSREYWSLGERLEAHGFTRPPSV
jgi:flavin reductase (DIM6/NTAB) family NADH-FMN oxidoreductase RutF